MNKELKNALEIVLADLEENNNHTVGKLLYWAYFEDEMTKDKALQTYRAWLLARDFIYYGKNSDNLEELGDYAGWLDLRDEQAKND